jgi:hypothetical protein
MNRGNVLLWLYIAWSTLTTLSVCIHAGGTEWAWNHGTCIHCMPGVSEFEIDISCASHYVMFLPVVDLYNVSSLSMNQCDHKYRRETWPASSYVSTDPMLLFFFQLSHHAKSLHKISMQVTMISVSLQHQWSGELFLGQMVSAGSQLPQQQMVGIKRLWLLLASAKLKASTSVVCRLRLNQLKCIIHWVSWQTELQGSVPLQRDSQSTW